MKRRRGNGRKPMKVQRFNLQIDADLKRWAKKYCERNRTNITAVVTSFLVDLRRREKEPDVEQI